MTDVPTTASARPPLDPQRVAWRDAAWDRIDADLLRDLVVAVVSTPSPTGEEAPVAELLARAMSEQGLGGRAQFLDPLQANALGLLPGRSPEGASLLLYAPLDTLHAGNAVEDVPATAAVLRPDMVATAVVDGDLVTGLGAGNPKGHVVCCVAAAAAVAAAGIPLVGDLVLGFGAGGMPTNSRTLQGRRNTGQGVGCSFALEQGLTPDFAVIAKPGWTVSWEEVGLAWFRLTVHGTHTYVGSRHRLPYRNPHVDAAELVLHLEKWFVEYAEAHTDGLVAPQGIVAHVQGGWERMLAVTPAAVHVDIDLRLSPRTTPAQAGRELRATVAEFSARTGARIDVTPTVAIPGSHTSPESYVVRSTVAAYESVAGSAHESVLGMSGATDANILRNRGIPTARVGMPKVPDLSIPGDFALGMNTVDLAEMHRLTRLLVEVAVDVCTRELKEIG